MRLQQIPSILFLLFICQSFLWSSCTQGETTVLWSKMGADSLELEQDKEECQALQRSVGVAEWRIHKCLETKGWSQIKEVAH